MSPGLAPSPLPVRALRCQRRTGEGSPSSLTCAVASAASSMSSTEAAWRPQRTGGAPHSSVREATGDVRAWGTPVGGRTAAVGWASAAAVCERACDGPEKLRPENKPAKTAVTQPNAAEDSSNAFSRLEGLRGDASRKRSIVFVATHRRVTVARVAGGWRREGRKGLHWDDGACLTVVLVEACGLGVDA